ncbi:MAG: filamentous hemagglutinin N-terminal domain-containing protein [Magnetococcus sp. YQC-5]
MNPRIKLGVLRLSALFASALLTCAEGLAGGIAGDGTMNPAFNGDLAKTGSVYAIKQDFGKTVGTNLFHSFAKFGLTAGETADFQGSNVSNIISRVTGGTKSEIDGTIKSSISGANLYFMNPNGVMFGPNASLDVSGSFHVTTADYLKFGEEGKFYANQSTSSQLVAVDPSAFGFLGAKTNGVVLDSSILIIQPSKDLSLVGGPISLNNSSLVSEGGNIFLMSANSYGEVNRNQNKISLQNMNALGVVSLQRDKAFTNYADLDVSNMTSNMNAGSILIIGKNLEQNGSLISADGGGRINVNVTDNVVLNGAGVKNGGMMYASSGSGKSGEIVINASAIDMKNNGIIAASPKKSGRSVGVTVVANQITLDDKSIISTSGDGSAGDIHVKTESMSISNESKITSDASSSAESTNGSIFLDAKQISIIRSSVQSVALKYDGGNINITSSDIFVDGGMILTVSMGAGKGGDMKLIVDNLILQKGGTIGSSSFSSGKGGSIMISSSKSVVVSGKTDTDYYSQIISGSLTKPGGNIDGGDSGNITLDVAKLSLIDGGMIISNTLGNGNAGNISVTTSGDLVMSKGKIKAQSQSDGFGKSGGIMLNVDNIIIEDSVITNSTSSSKDSGGITIKSAKDVELSKGAIIGATTRGDANGGSINITAFGDVRLIGTNETMTTSIQSGAPAASTNGASGDIILTMKNLSVTDGANIIAFSNNNAMSGNVTINASGNVKLSNYSNPYVGTIDNGSGVDSSGKAGGITLTATNLYLTEGGSVESSSYSKTGKGGNIAITVPGEVVLSGASTAGKLSGIISQVYSSGSGGFITLVAGSLNLKDSAFISASTHDQGDAGSIMITTLKDVMLSNKSAIDAASKGAGNSGSITLSAESLILDKKALISVSTVTGQGGSIIINTSKDITISGGGYINASTVGSGQGGSVLIKSVGDMLLVDDTDKAYSNIQAGSKGSGSAGLIYINVANLFLKQGGYITGSTLSGGGDGGSIRITASEDIILSGFHKLQNSLTIFTSSFGTGRSGDITLNSKNLYVTDRNGISTTAYNRGNAGALTIKTLKNMTLSSGEIVSASNQSIPGAGAAGPITIDADELYLIEGGKIIANTKGPGQAGSIKIKSSGDVIISGGDSNGSSAIQSMSTGTMSSAGASGSIAMDVDNLFLTEGGIINANTEGTGHGGSIKINVLRDMTVSGENSNNSSTIQTKSSGIMAGAGVGGNINITAANLFLKDGGFINAGTLGTGKGGSVLITASGDVTLSGDDSKKATSRIEVATSGIITGAGVGGDINIQVANLFLKNGGWLNANSDGTGKGGSIIITASGEVILSGKNSQQKASTIQAKADSGGGGNITMQVVNKIYLNESNISSSVQGGDGKGGNITIDPINLILKDSQIQANAFQGEGGKVSIQAQSLIKNPSSSITASSALGVQGTVSVDTPNVNPVDSLSALPIAFFDASSLMSERCSARRGNTGSSFVIKSRGGLPLMPGDLLASHGVPAQFPLVSMDGDIYPFNMVGMQRTDANVLCLM